MKLSKYVLPTLALGILGVLITPGTAASWSVLGFSLNVFRRTARLFDNFTSAGANNNTTPDPQFPGKVGAELALWKAVVEWGSEPHGNGSGDPTQAVLGSGNANFDAHFTGNATSEGIIGHNVMSQLGGCSGGVFAFMQGDANGWWVRFYQCWSWADGPGGIGGGEADLQGIGCHEYGHSLGLGHSNDPSATMYGSASTGSTSNRSIESDDVAGLQFVYGVKAANKPKITSVSGFGGGTVTITGSNFPLTGNEVWFSRLAASPSGTISALTVSNISSTGTVIQVTPPAGAGPGDVLVRNQAFVTGNGLSNAMPWDPSACPATVTYCTAKPGLSCGVPVISAFGMPSASSPSGFFITAGPARSNKTGLLIYTSSGRNNAAFQGGTLCIGTSPLRRTVTVSSGGFSTCDGEFAIDMNAFAAGAQGGNPAAFLLTVGQKVNAQWWGRDTQPTGSFLSNGVEYYVCP
jgi:hypothetical protein